MSVLQMFQFWMVKGFAEVAAGILVCLLIILFLVIYVFGSRIHARLLTRRDREIIPAAGQTWIDEDGDRYVIQFVNPSAIGIAVPGNFGGCSFSWSPGEFEAARKRRKLHLRNAPR